LQTSFERVSKLMPVNKIRIAICCLLDAILNHELNRKLLRLVYCLHYNESELQKPIRYNTHHLEERSAAPALRCRNWFDYIISYVNTSPIRYGFCIAAQAIRATATHATIYIDLPTSRSRIASGERRSREPRDRLVSLAGIWIWLKILARKLLRLIITHVSFTFQLNFVNRLSFDFSIVDFRSAQIWEHSNF
jgi:hypothetical protein